MFCLSPISSSVLCTTLNSPSEKITWLRALCKEIKDRERGGAGLGVGKRADKTLLACGRIHEGKAGGMPDWQLATHIYNICVSREGKTLGFYFRIWDATEARVARLPCFS